MTTRERAAILASVGRDFPKLGDFSAADLLEWIRLELGHEEILDGFRPYAGHFSQARLIGPVLHVLSGNTPHAGLQTVLRAALLGGRHFIKYPSAGLPEVADFVSRVRECADFVESEPGTHDVPPAWLREASACVVFGSDETIRHFRSLLPAGVVLDAHGHRFSVGLVFNDPRYESALHAARDVAAFNQQGCLSPHDIYVAGDARRYAEALAVQLAEIEKLDPRGPLSVQESAEIAGMRANYRFRAVSDQRVGLWESPGSTAWTVIYEEDPWFAASCLNRTVFVKPLPASPQAMVEAMGPSLPWVAAVGVWPATPESAEFAAALSPSRICPLGHMQRPSLFWHQEGRQSLSPLVRWIDFEPSA